MWRYVPLSGATERQRCGRHRGAGGAAGATRAAVHRAGGHQRLGAVDVAALALAELPVAPVTPRRVRDLAKATGRLARTDAVDAPVLAHFAQAVQPAAHPQPEAQSLVLAALEALFHKRRSVYCPGDPYSYRGVYQARHLQRCARRRSSGL
jgi:hypothetical protein